MLQTCKNCQSSFEVTREDLQFLEKVSPVFGGKKELIPPPLLCPPCRLQRRLAFRNQMYVYTRPSSLTGKPIFSQFTEDTPFPVFENEEWWKDSWDPMAYGRPFDFSRSFFEQFEELRSKVPHFALDVANMENSDYCSNASELRNCYLVFNTGSAEDCMYCENAWHSKDCIDCTRIPHCELCYDCVQCTQCYNLQSSESCEDCSDSLFLLNCRSCRNCCGCVNLRRKEYCMFNEELAKEDYAQRLAALRPDSYSGREAAQKEVEAFWLKHPRPHRKTHLVENVTGNYIFESKGVFESTFIRGGEDLRYCFNLDDHVKDAMDHSFFGLNSELTYECCVCGYNAFHLCFCWATWLGTSNACYCFLCHGCDECFGCVSLRKKRYCILNKQYSREEYEQLVPKIIEHMRRSGAYGEFFPITLSPHPYNRSIAARYFPMTQEEVQRKGLRWYERDDVSREGDSPSIVTSMKTGRPFRITSREIQRYRTLKVPLPRLTYDERMEERAQKLGRLTLYERRCAKTGNPLRTTFPPDSSWIIWDEEVYEREFSG